jgi:hypothetical protein
VRRGKYNYVYCKINPKHKQRQGYHTFAMSDEQCICDAEREANISITLNQTETNQNEISTSILSFFKNSTMKLLKENTSSQFKSYRYIPGLGIRSIFIR